MFSALIWKIRGIGNNASKRRLRKLCRLHNFSLLVLIEPFISVQHISDLKYFFPFEDFLALDNNKIWVMWRSGFLGRQLTQSDQFLHMQFKFAGSSDFVYLTWIYAKSTRVERRLLWTDLLSLSNDVGEHPWLIAGDFNVIASLDEYVGPSLTQDLASINDFRGFMNEAALSELPVSGGSFTWTGMRRGGRVWKKLDRALFSPSWLSRFPDCHVELLNRATSDHNPLLFRMPSPVPSTPRPFKFQHFWLLRSDFMDLVQHSWGKPVEGFGMLRFSLKLRRLKSDLRAWNRSVVGNVHLNSQRAEVEVKALEVAFDESGSPDDLMALHAAQARYYRSLAEGL